MSEAIIYSLQFIIELLNKIKKLLNSKGKEEKHCAGVSSELIKQRTLPNGLGNE